MGSYCIPLTKVLVRIQHFILLLILMRIPHDQYVNNMLLISCACLRSRSRSSYKSVVLCIDMPILAIIYRSLAGVHRDGCK